MADAPIMSGANAAVAATAPETEQVAQASSAVQQQTETVSPSLPATAAAKTNAADEAATEDATTTQASAAATSSPTEPADVPAAAPGVLAVPQPPAPALVRDRSDSLAINAADNAAAPVTSASAADSGLVCNIKLLLPNGNRHPFRIDERYLDKRGVDVPDVTESGRKDPFSVSIYKLKELILREWREEWEGKPASPSSIRLIHFGKLLDDKEQLRKYHFSPDSPNVVHMSVKPADVVDEDDATKAKNGDRETRSRDGSGSSGGGCCVIL